MPHAAVRQHACLATILDVGRLPSAMRLTQVWPGPVSAAILAKHGVDLNEQHKELRAADGHGVVPIRLHHGSGAGAWQSPLGDEDLGVADQQRDLRIEPSGAARADGARAA